MSVLIKGMEMPFSCDDCRLKSSYVYAVRTEECSYYRRSVDPYVGMGKRPDWCPLVEVPTPHGRLIDADALHYSRIRIAHNDSTIGGYNAVVMSAEIKDAPTIIEAEEET